MKIGIIDLCKQIEDPRMNRKKVHKMETIIYISIAAGTGGKFCPGGGGEVRLAFL